MRLIKDCVNNTGSTAYKAEQSSALVTFGLTLGSNEITSSLVNIDNSFLARPLIIPRAYNFCISEFSSLLKASIKESIFLHGKSKFLNQSFSYNFLPSRFNLAFSFPGVGSNPPWMTPEFPSDVSWAILKFFLK